MKYKTIKTSLPNKFETFILDDEGKLIEGSQVVLDFNPLIKSISPKDDNYIILHNKARPTNDKSLWRWGIFYRGEYYCVEEIQGIAVNFKSADLYNLTNPDYPPTHVLYIPSCKLEIEQGRKCTIIPLEN